MTTQPDSLGLYPNPYEPTLAEWMDAAVKATLAMAMDGSTLAQLDWKDPEPITAAGRKEAEGAMEALLGAQWVMPSPEPDHYTPDYTLTADGSMIPTSERAKAAAAGVDQMSATAGTCPSCEGDGFNHWTARGYPMSSDDPCPACDGSGMQP